MRESRIENYFRTKAEAGGAICIKMDASVYAGIPDRLVLLPGGRALFVELKAPGKKPRKLQLHVHNRLRSLGYRVEVVDSIEAAKILLDEIQTT